MSKIRIHFVCTGNTFRSRLAEAYLKSKKRPGIKVSSSGLKADLNEDGPITWYGARLCYRNNLIPFLKKYWSKTQAEDFRNADLIIFMNKKHFERAKTELGYHGKNYQIWDIPDMDEIGFKYEPYTVTEIISQLQASERIFTEITKKIDGLIASGRLG